MRVVSPYFDFKRFNFFSTINLTWLSLGVLLLWDLTSLDLALANLSNNGSFALRYNFILQIVLHNWIQKCAWLLYFILLASCIYPYSIFKQLHKLQRLQLALMPLVSVLAINVLKNYSNTSCPWNLAIFGGDEQYSSHWLNFFRSQNGVGNCFPAGHAISGFAFIGGFLVWRKVHHKIAQTWLVCALSLGLFLGLVQQIRGAHFMSHTLWSAWFCWVFSYLTYNLTPYVAHFNKTHLKSIIKRIFSFKINAWQLILLTSLWLTISGNFALFSKLQEYSLFNVSLVVGLSAIIFGVLNFILGLLAFKHLLKISLIFLLLITATAGYFASNYGVLINPSMLQNVIQTDSREAYDLISFSLICHILIYGIVPSLWITTVNVQFKLFKKAIWHNLVFALANLIATLAIIWLIFQPLAGSMRTHKDLRYLLNPLASIYSLTAVSLSNGANLHKTLQPIGDDAVLISSSKPKLMLLIVGETARSTNFSLNGYERLTNPYLAQIKNVVSFSNAYSCGTSTAESLPCMFSHLEREKHIKNKNHYENLLDVLAKSGLAVLWLDNQAGCKGVCKRVANFEFNNGGFDDQMLANLDEKIANLDPLQTKNGVVIVMHQMGSHGPAYSLRSPTDHKKFMPECTSSYLSACSPESLFNAYDNSILYTDYFLAESIAWLQRQVTNFDPALIYVSDHGESLGERNIYLHGMPYAIAPKWQKHVGWITYLSDEFLQNNHINNNCLAHKKDEFLNHDYLFHSVLGILQVQTKLYHPHLDIFANCRQ